MKLDCTEACEQCTRRFPGTMIRQSDDGAHHCAQCLTDPAYRHKFSADNNMLPGPDHVGHALTEAAVLNDHTLPPLSWVEIQVIKPWLPCVSFTGTI